MAQTNKSKRIQLERLQAECDAWNAVNPPGTDVMLNRDGWDKLFPTKTRSTAYVMSGHSAVIFLEEISGCYLLSHVTPAAT